MSDAHLSVTDLASVAGPGVGGGIAVWAGFKFLRWLAEFVFGRFDISRTHVGERLKHVEQELDAYREATMLMIAVVAKLDPENPALARVARILRMTVPHATLELNELADRLKDLP